MILLLQLIPFYSFYPINENMFHLDKQKSNLIFCIKIIDCLTSGYFLIKEEIGFFFHIYNFLIKCMILKSGNNGNNKIII